VPEIKVIIPQFLELNVRNVCKKEEEEEEEEEVGNLHLEWH
jgi:hypothetical protein